MSTNKKNKKIRKYGVRSFLLILVAIGVVVLTVFELYRYETNFLEIYASEQDGYVMVTIDQIERLGPNASEEDITEIISSLDSDAGNYWTLTSGDNILFIKSVTETNRYKNLTTDSYYGNGSAMDFVKGLRNGAVTHSIIYFDNDRYVASGSQFEWKGKKYSICLMTYDYAILEQNALLESKYTIFASVCVVMALYVCVIMLAYKRNNKSLNQIADYEKERIRYNKVIEKLHVRMHRYESYTPRYHTFKEEIIPVFLKSLQKNGIRSVRVAIFKVSNKEEKKAFLERSVLFLDDSVLKFEREDGNLLLLFAGTSEAFGKQIAASIENKYIEIIKTAYWELSDVSYSEKYKTFIEAAEDNN